MVRRRRGFCNGRGLGRYRRIQSDPIQYSHDFVDHYRGDQKRYDYMWEERWVRDEGYSKIIPEAVSGLFNKLSISIENVDKLVFPCFFKTEHKQIGRKLGAGQKNLLTTFMRSAARQGPHIPWLCL